MLDTFFRLLPAFVSDIAPKMLEVTFCQKVLKDRMSDDLWICGEFNRWYSKLYGLFITLYITGSHRRCISVAKVYQSLHNA